jgi:Mg2+ and Co2+ transporter CorA
VQIVEFTADTLRFADALPTLPASEGFVWIFLDREDFALHQARLQDAAQQLGGSQLLDLHCKDLTSAAHPSHYDYTSIYDLIIFRRLASKAETRTEDDTEAPGSPYGGQDGRPQISARAGTQTFHKIRSRAVGFVIFDRLLISVHPPECYAARGFIERCLADAKFSVDTSSARNRIPASPADMALRMINSMVDSYLVVRKELAAQLDHWQTELLRPDSRFTGWGQLMAARSQLHILEDLCDEQHDAMQEWLDTLREQPLSSIAADRSLAQAQQDQLVARARDVIEHIERVMHHARRLEQSAETVVQVHFSAQSNRTNDIMRTLTVLTAVFLPLNLIAGIFGMNFEFIPLLHLSNGFWLAIVLMVLTAATLVLFFWRKRYLERSAR